MRLQSLMLSSSPFRPAPPSPSFGCCVDCTHAPHSHAATCTVDRGPSKVYPSRKVVGELGECLLRKIGCSVRERVRPAPSPSISAHGCGRKGRLARARCRGAIPVGMPSILLPRPKPFTTSPCMHTHGSSARTCRSCSCTHMADTSARDGRAVSRACGLEHLGRHRSK